MNNGEETAFNRFPNLILARYLRIYPIQYTNNPCMRLEVYGCTALDFTPPPPTTECKSHSNSSL